MPAWLIPALKAILPHVGTIVSAAAPVFTRKKAEEPASQTALLQQQISELQAAASQNAEHVKELAGQLQRTVAALEEAAEVGEVKLRRAIQVGVLAAGVSALSFAVALLALLAR